MNIINKKIDLCWTNFKLLNKLKGNSVTNYNFFKVLNFYNFCYCGTCLRHHNLSYTTDCPSVPCSHSVGHNSIEDEVSYDFELYYGGDINMLTARYCSCKPVWWCGKLHGLSHVWYSFCPIIPHSTDELWSLVLPDVLSSFLLFADKLSAVANSEKKCYVDLYKDGDTHCFY